VVFLFGGDGGLRTHVTGSKKLSGTAVTHGCVVYEPKDGIFNACFLCGPEGVSPRDGTNIPAIQLVPYGIIYVAFLLVEPVRMRTQVPGSKKSYGMIFHEPWFFMENPKGQLQGRS